MYVCMCVCMYVCVRARARVLGKVVLVPNVFKEKGKQQSSVKRKRLRKQGRRKDRNRTNLVCGSGRAESKVGR